jgi:hypothetical protein
LLARALFLRSLRFSRVTLMTDGFSKRTANIGANLGFYKRNLQLT